MEREEEKAGAGSPSGPAGEFFEVTREILEQRELEREEEKLSRARRAMRRRTVSRSLSPVLEEPASVTQVTSPGSERMRMLVRAEVRPLSPVGIVESPASPGETALLGGITSDEDYIANWADEPLDDLEEGELPSRQDRDEEMEVDVVPSCSARSVAGPAEYVEELRREKREAELAKARVRVNKKRNPRRQLHKDDWESGVTPRPQSLIERTSTISQRGLGVRGPVGTVENSEEGGVSAKKHAPIAQWRDSLRTKTRGGIFGEVERIPTVPRLDPPPHACFNCWQRGHVRHDCPRPVVATYCHNCGRRGVTLSTCPRCSKVHAGWLESQGYRERKPSTSRAPSPAPSATRTQKRNARRRKAAQGTGTAKKERPVACEKGREKERREELRRPAAPVRSAAEIIRRRVELANARQAERDRALQLQREREREPDVAEALPRQVEVASVVSVVGAPAPPPAPAPVVAAAASVAPTRPAGPPASQDPWGWVALMDRWRDASPETRRFLSALVGTAAENPQGPQ